MKEKQKPLSFSLCNDNIKYVLKVCQVKHRNRSHWMDDLLTHLRTKAEQQEKPVKRSAAKTYPSNIEDQFNILWSEKGKKGAKQKAYAKYKSMLCGASDETCEQLTELLVDDIKNSMGEIGFPELHLTTYLNQERWEK